MSSESWLGELLLAYGYLSLFPGVWFFGPLAALLAGVFARFDVFNLWLAYGILLFAALLGDIFWYWVGARWGHSFIGRFGRYVSVTEEHVARVNELFHKYHSPIILLTKVTNIFGLMIPVLVAAGMARIPFSRFVALNLVGEAVFTGGLIGIGYFFGDLYLRIDNYLGRALIIGFLVALAAASIGFGRYVRGRVYGESPHNHRV